MKFPFAWRSEYALLIAWFVTLVSTASYVAIIDVFDLGLILFILFVGTSLGVLVYWTRDEPSEDVMCDEVDDDPKGIER